MATMTRLGLRTGLTAAVFGVGFVCGSVAQRPAVADMKDLTGSAMEAAGGQGGALGAAAKLGTTMTGGSTESPIRCASKIRARPIPAASKACLRVLSCMWTRIVL